MQTFLFRSLYILFVVLVHHGSCSYAEPVEIEALGDIHSNDVINPIEVEHLKNFGAYLIGFAALCWAVVLCWRVSVRKKERERQGVIKPKKKAQ